MRTVLSSNMTIIHNGIEGFKEQMENKLTKAYRNAYGKQRYKRDVIEEELAAIPPRLGRRIRSPDGQESDKEEQIQEQQEEANLPTVKIHNIRSSLPEPEIEMIYTVYKGIYKRK